jgi:flagellar basal-body rod protein FlgB
MINGMFDGGSMPVLERVTQFTHERHRALSDNIANLSTPYYKPRDLNTGDFQAAMRDAIDRRRVSANPSGGPLQLQDTRELRFGKDSLDAMPGPVHEGILFHDQNNRDLERTMQHLAENTLAHGTAIEVLRSEFAIMLTAIRERV